jgi:hypothetical protein
METQKNTPVSISTAKLLANDFDLDGDVLIISGLNASTAQGGTVVLAGGSLQYSPAADFTGTDSLTFTVSDGRGGTAIGTLFISVIDPGAPSKNIVSININPENDHTVIVFAGIPGRLYGIQTAPTVAGPWSDARTLSAEPTGLFTFEDATDPRPAERFYRTIGK